MREYMCRTNKGFAYIEDNKLSYSKDAKPIKVSDLMRLRKSLKRQKITTYYLGEYGANPITTEERIIACQCRRNADCKKCLHGCNEMNDCDLLEKYLNETKGVRK